MHYKNFIFDLDGTLIDTEAAVLKTWQCTLQAYGYAFSLHDVRAVLGVTTEAGLAALHATVDANYTALWQQNYARFAKDAAYFPGAKELLTALRARGCSVGAVSSRSRAEYRAYFGTFGFQTLLGTVVLEEDTQKHKPDGAPLLHYLATTGCAAAESIYIGDMPTDMQCAQNAGVSCGLVQWNGSHVSAPAGYFFTHPQQVLALA